MHRVYSSRFGLATLACWGTAMSLALGCLRAVPLADETPAESDPVASNDVEPASNDGTTVTEPMTPAPQTPGDRDSEPGWGIVEQPEEKVTYAEVVRRVTGMVGEGALQEQVTRRGLNLMNLTWEDTGRYQNSSVGPNISDLTLQVR